MTKLKQPRISISGKFEAIRDYIYDLIEDGWYISDFTSLENGFTEIKLYR